MEQEVADVLAKQVPLRYFLSYMESKSDIVMKLAPFDQEPYTLLGLQGYRKGSLSRHSNIFAILCATIPEAFAETVEYDAVVETWLDNIIYYVPEV